MCNRCVFFRFYCLPALMKSFTLLPEINTNLRSELTDTQTKFILRKYLKTMYKLLKYKLRCDDLLFIFVYIVKKAVNDSCKQSNDSSFRAQARLNLKKCQNSLTYGTKILKTVYKYRLYHI